MGNCIPLIHSTGQVLKIFCLTRRGQAAIPSITQAGITRFTAALLRKIPMLEVCPITLKEANAFVEQHHRHHKPVVGHKFSIGCTDGEKIVGVAIIGRPVSRYLDDGWTLEVNRLCTDGTRNACSILYAAAWRAARAMGYRKLITYILDSESGTSLRAAGWRCVGQAGGLRWTGKRRPAVDRSDTEYNPNTSLPMLVSCMVPGIRHRFRFPYFP